MNDIGTAHEVQCLTHIVIGDEHANAALGQVADQRADVINGDRVDTRKRLVE